MKNKEVIVTQINVTSGHLLQKGEDTKTNWPTDCRSQCDFDLEILERFQSKALHMVVDAPWYVSNTVI
jgi:hypothetical protein